ncbi:hypothetical protein ACG02S_07905 [Roseateles sp. DC23W]|uniref:Uncharacterized protein n=1 Tax=Pelomonas dachongensis TaxID=3299029 RepID=A0ABW7EMA9_9BURK
MPKPLSNALAQQIVSITLEKLRLSLADEKQETSPGRTAALMEVALRRMVGAVGGPDAEQALCTLLGRPDDTFPFGDFTLWDAHRLNQAGRKTRRYVPVPRVILTPNARLQALARRVAALNPQCAEIGAGMLASLVDDAKHAVREVDASSAAATGAAA